MSDLLTIDLASIDVDKKTNPRSTVDADQLQPLVDSIALYGVLQPILVRPNDAGDRYLLVAGQRRFTAAGIAGLTKIPAVVRYTNGDTAAVALVENLQREQLTPIEEAHAFRNAIAAGTTTAELAGQISKTEDLVKARLELLELPDVAQKHVDTGALGLGTAAALRTLAPAGDVVLAKAAELLTGTEKKRWHHDPLAPRDVAHNPAAVLDYVLQELVREKGTKLPFLADPGSFTDVLNQELPWPKDVAVAALRKKAARLPEYDSNYVRVRRDALQLNGADLDAARAYGCLIEIANDSDGVESWVSDPVWLADRVDQKLDTAIAKQADKAKKGTASTKATTSTKEADAQAALREERAKQRRAQLSARERNVTLGIALTKKLHAPKPTVDNMRLIGELLLEYAGEDLARRGTRLVDETAQTVSTRKDGTISNVAYLKTARELRALLDERLAKASTVEQIVGVLLQAIVAAHLADKKALPTSDQYGEVRGLGGYGGSSRAKQLVAKVAAPFKAKRPAATSTRRTAKRTTTG